MKSTGVIAFCGSKGAGKSASYEIFKELFTGNIEEIALAGHLKEVCSKVFNVDMKYFIDPSLKEVELENYVNLEPRHIEAIYHMFFVQNYAYDCHVRPHIGQVFETPRRLLQYVGTEILHPIDPLIHSKITLNKKDSKKLTVVTDLRFKAEFDYFKETLGKDFIPVYVKNSNAELMASSDPHPSERQLILFKDECYAISNEDSKSDLSKRLQSLLNELFSSEEPNVKQN